MQRFRSYLYKKYDVTKAYLFMGAFDIQRQDLYSVFQEYGYILVFREHGINFKGSKKGNVDTDIVFEMMRDALTNDQLNKVILVSGDGDYFRTVKFLRSIDKLGKVLLPSHQNASSLYKQLSNQYFAFLDSSRVKKILEK